MKAGVGLSIAWEIFYEKINTVLKDTLDKDIIIFGSNPGGEFIKWFYEYFYQKKVVAIVDRWNSDNHYLVHHLMALYYLWSEKTVIINTLPENIGPEVEFNAIGEVWERTNWKKKQIIPLHREIFGENGKDRYITFFDWLEEEYALDILTSIRRCDVKGKEGHGYYPTDFRMIFDTLSNELFDKDTAIMDFGCGKGAAMMTLGSCGFRKVGGIEYTDSIYHSMCTNLETLGCRLEKCTAQTVHENGLNEDGFYCYLGDAADLQEELDHYHNFYLFNPFSYMLTAKVISNILDSLKRKPRRIMIFYAEPICHQLLIDSGYFKLLKEIGCGMGGITYQANIYESM